MPLKPKISDQKYLLHDQYRDASNLGARIRIHQLFSTNRYGWMRWVFDQFDLSPNSRLLELGCGPGLLWRENLARIPAGWDLTLSDFSPGMLDEARRNLESSGRPFRFELIDAQSIPFENDSFDAVIANHMLYHVPDRSTALEEARRVLKSGGRFYASTIGRSHLRELGVLMSRFDPELASPHDTFPWAGGGAGSFVLESGAAELAGHFSSVTLHRYEDSLIVTEAGPLVDYILSGSSRALFTGERKDRFRSFVEQELAAHGAILVTKDSGIFEAR